MIGREAYHNPWWLASWDARHFGQADYASTREDIEERMVDYMLRLQAEEGMGWYGIARHMLGLRHGLPGARHWRQVWSDHRLKTEDPRHVMALARQGREVAAPAAV
jgi:tRNA-dihydrouridine synthase A